MRNFSIQPSGTWLMTSMLTATLFLLDQFNNYILVAESSYKVENLVFNLRWHILKYIYIHATILQWTHLVLKHVRFLAVHIVKYFVVNISITANMRNIAYELLYVGLTDIWYGYGFLRNVSCWLKCLPYIYLIVRNYVCSSRNEKVI